jgi:hypothetical protein
MRDPADKHSLALIYMTSQNGRDLFFVGLERGAEVRTRRVGDNFYGSPKPNHRWWQCAIVTGSPFTRLGAEIGHSDLGLRLTLRCHRTDEPCKGGAVPSQPPDRPSEVADCVLMGMKRCHRQGKRDCPAKCIKLCAMRCLAQDLGAAIACFAHNTINRGKHRREFRMSTKQQRVSCTKIRTRRAAVRTVACGSRKRDGRPG